MIIDVREFNFIEIVKAGYKYYETTSIPPIIQTINDIKIGLSILLVNREREGFFLIPYNYKILNWYAQFNILPYLIFNEENLKMLFQEHEEINNYEYLYKDYYITEQTLDQDFVVLSTISKEEAKEVLTEILLPEEEYELLNYIKNA